MKGQHDSYMYSKQVTSNGETYYVHPAAAESKNVRYEPKLSCSTVYEGFYKGWEYSKKNGDLRLLGHRTGPQGLYKWMDYPEVEATCSDVCSRFVQKGLQKGDTVGIYSRTRPEWMLTFIACQFQSLIVVPLYDTLGDQSMEHIVKQSGFRVAVVSLTSEARKLIQILDKIPDSVLKHVIVVEWPSVEAQGEEAYRSWMEFLKQEIEPRGIECESFEQCKALGRENPATHVAPSPDDVVEICYTSGTTGMPKGAVFKHLSMMTECNALQKYIADNVESSTFETTLCYLPLAHTYEIAVECFCIVSGHKLGYYSGDARKILEDIKVLKPTMLTAVPRVLERIHQGMEQKTSRQEAGFMRSMLFRLALKQKIALMDKGKLKETAIDKIFFGKLHKEFGGNLKIMFVGSSSTPPNTLRVLRAVLGCDVCEGYGQTETYGVTFCQLPRDRSTRCVGAPFASVEFKVIDVPELNYKADNNEGELCVRGLTTIQEYYKLPDVQCRDQEGWIHTGDVARVNANGTISIIDRVKEVFKLSQGEYVIPSKVEEVYGQCKEIEKVFIWGNPLKTCCVAIVSLNNDEMEKSLAKAKILNVDRGDYHKSRPVKAYLLKEMDRVALKNGLKGFEKAKNVHISPVSLLTLSDLFTPTMKVKRHAFIKHFEREIAMMYEAIVDKPL